MKIVIVGAGSVGRSIARELMEKGHRLVLIDRKVTPERRTALPGVPVSYTHLTLPTKA